MSAVDRAQIVVYNGHDNANKVLVDNAGVSENLTLNTLRITFTVDTVIVDSDQDAAAITWDVDGLVTMHLGNKSLVAGSYSNCRLVLYDAVNTNGVMWAELDVTVK